jgi:hypothetical protein
MGGRNYSLCCTFEEDATILSELSLAGSNRRLDLADTRPLTAGERDDF